MMQIKKKLIDGIPYETISYEDEWTEKQKADYEKNLNQLAESFLCP